MLCSRLPERAVPRIYAFYPYIAIGYGYHKPLQPVKNTICFFFPFGYTENQMSMSFKFYILGYRIAIWIIFIVAIVQ